MNDGLMMLLLLPAAFAAHLGWVAYVYARKRSKFRIEDEAHDRFTIVTDEGKFSVNRSSGVMAWRSAGRPFSVRLEDIVALDYRVEERDALGSEFLLGFDFMDLFKQHHDSIEWHEISAVSVSGPILLFRSGQLQRREFLMGWWIGFEEALLERIGLLKDARRQTKLALAVLQSRLGKPLAR